MNVSQNVIVGLKRELKVTREKVRDAKVETARWRNVALTLRKLAGLDEAKFKNLLQAESLPFD
ncbi:hypothetical protein [Bradyrhizobium neotropicale]|uniref:hypothetical protein n=1 Tax=Bradyrhizobium neotropicale TaxID=1497615 RepID=UPI001AD674B1|nr:hypothetical protein [Bradyrhizobium neotropicale]MBO4227217.1 hypothetical protein [Bradyrhizobium neotropicale]